MIPWILLIALLGVYVAAVPQLLKRAGQSSSLQFIPLLNLIPLLKILHRPWWWWLLLLVPGVNLIMLVIINVETGIAFGQRSTAKQWLFGVLPWYALLKLAFRQQEAAFIGPRDWKGKKKGFFREWGEAIVFAVVAATVIRTFAFEAFTIPTPSMENSMLVGDYLFVSKMSYGAKVPQTPFSVPFVHNALPGSMTNSYTEWFSLPYFRLPGWGKVKRYDPVVFNFPSNDTIIVHPTLAGYDYQDYLRKEGIFIAGSLEKYLNNRAAYDAKARKHFVEDKYIACTGTAIEGLRTRPMDKKENFVKRCVGLPGEKLELRERRLFINDKPVEDPEGAMWSYDVRFKLTQTDNERYRAELLRVLEKFEIAPGNLQPVHQHTAGANINLALTNAQYDKLRQSSLVDFIAPCIDSLVTEQTNLDIFPNSPLAPFNAWTRDNFGPVVIPARGMRVSLTPENVALYQRAIEVYEGNSWEESGGKIFINGKEATEYTFKQDYYWMMGDNRHRSLDARYWGFVPFDHIVGKPVFTWLSKNQQAHNNSSSVRWNRMFRFVK